MKKIIPFITFLLLGCGALSEYPFLSGTWISTGSHQTSMLILRENGTAEFFAKIGSPWAKTWVGLWKQEGTKIMFMNKQGFPETVAHLEGKGLFYMYFNNEIYTFHRYGSRE